MNPAQLTTEQSPSGISKQSTHGKVVLEISEWAIVGICEASACVGSISTRDAFETTRLNDEVDGGDSNSPFAV